MIVKQETRLRTDHWLCQCQWGTLL